MKNIDYRVLKAKDNQNCGVKKIHAYPWTDCFAKEQTLDILKYIQSSRTKYTITAPAKTVKKEGINHPKHGLFFTSRDNPHRKFFGTYPTDKTFKEKFSVALNDRNPEKLVVFVYNHDLINNGTSNRCDPTNIPFYLRHLVKQNTGYVAYSFCAPNTISSLNDKATASSRDEIRLAELKALLNKFKDNKVNPKNIFLVGDHYGATTNVLAALEFGSKFNSHLSFFPDKDPSLKRPHSFFAKVDKLTKNPKEAIRIASNAPGLIYSKQELLKGSPLKKVAKQNQWAFVVSPSCESSKNVSYENNCFYDNNYKSILQFIEERLHQPRQQPTS